MPNLQTAEMNRFGRDLYRRALDLRFKAEDGETLARFPIGYPESAKTYRNHKSKSGLKTQTPQVQRR